MVANIINGGSCRGGSCRGGSCRDPLEIMQLENYGVCKECRHASGISGKDEGQGERGEGRGERGEADPSYQDQVHP